jgi:hypothetical protein
MKKILTSIPFKYALATTAGIIAYFGIARLLGFADNYALRFLNGIIMFIGVFLSIKKYKDSKESPLKYLNGLGIGLQTSAYVTIMFVLCVLIYGSIDPEFISRVIENKAFLGATNIYIIAAITALEAAGSGFIISLASMQYLKESRATEEEEEESKDFVSSFSEQS